MAEKFGKEHRNVIQSIRELLKGAADFSAHPMYVESVYIHPQNGQEYPMYIMNRDGFTLLAMGFTGEKALQFKLEYINAFNKMEETIKNGGFNVPKSFREALLLAAEQQEVIENQQKQIEEKNAKIELDKPKVLFSEAVTTSKTSILIGDLAKIIKQNGVEMGQNRLFSWLRDNGYLIKRKGSDFNMPTQKSMEMKLFEIKETAITHSDGHVTVNKTPKVTGAGQVFFVNKFLNK